MEKELEEFKRRKNNNRNKIINKIFNRKTWSNICQYDEKARHIKKKEEFFKKGVFQIHPKKYINSDGKAGFYVKNKDGITIDTEGNMTYRKNLHMNFNKIVFQLSCFFVYHML